MLLFSLLAFLIHIAGMPSPELRIREDNLESRVRRGMTSLKEYAWTNATIPYNISEQFSKYNVQSTQLTVYLNNYQILYPKGFAYELLFPPWYAK